MQFYKVEFKNGRMYANNATTKNAFLKKVKRQYADPKGKMKGLYKMSADGTKWNKLAIPDQYK